MMQSEFEKLVGNSVSSQDYSINEYVYTWHPVIDNVKGKHQIADLYKVGGMAVIKGMVEVAKKAERIESRLGELRSEMDYLSARLIELRDGDWSVNLKQEQEA